MKLTRSYTCKISGNLDKTKYLKDTLDLVDQLSNFVYDMGVEFWKDFKDMYRICRLQFPELNSKVLQNFLRYHYSPKGKQTIPKKAVRSKIIIDYQSFGVRKDPLTKLTSFWIRFHRKNFPLLGKHLLDRITDCSKVKEIQIYQKKNKLYCKLAYTVEIEEPKCSCQKNTVGLDINSKRLVLSNNRFYSMKQLYHRKLEKSFKNNQKHRNINNYTKDFVHKLTTKMVKDLLSTGTEVLILEDLTHLRKSATKKTYQKKLNYIVNSMPFSMIRSFLTYKCLVQGIRVTTIDSAYTSQTCSRCRSRNTERPRQQDFICNDCQFKIDADLNASRNIRFRYIQNEWDNSESVPPLDVNATGSHRT